MDSPTNIINKELLIRLQSGDEDAFNTLYWHYNSYVYRFINSLLYDSSLAEDLTQNVFLKIWEKRKNIDPDQGFEAYLFTIARHMIYKETENRLNIVISSDSEMGQTEPIDDSPEEKIDAASLQAYINTLINQLPDSRKRIFKMSRQEHLSNKEIAAKLSISEKTVENQITRALHFLKEQLSKDSNLMILMLLFIKSC